LTGIRVKLRKTKMPGSAIDTTSPLTILVSLASGTINSATPAMGVLINATGLGAQHAIITVQPDASGIVKVAIVSSGDIVATVMLRHRTFSTAAAIV
jgi:hypothetical protein